VSREHDATVVHVDGRLAVGGVRELDRAATVATGAVILDLTNLLSVDDAGVAALRVLSERGARLRGASPYVTLLLGEDRARGRGR
jgi:anti-anti-sigma regulatory factor